MTITSGNAPTTAAISTFDYALKIKDGLNHNNYATIIL